MTQPEATMDLWKEQIATLMSKMEELQQKQVALESSHMVYDDNDEGPAGNLVMLTESMQAFLEAALSTTFANADRKKWVKCIGVPDCDSIWCSKLDPVIQAIMPNDTIKADGTYLTSTNSGWT